MAKKVDLSVRNEIGAAEVDSYVVKKDTGWQAVLNFLNSKKTKKVVWSIVRLVLLLGLAFLILFPLLQTISLSLKTENDLYDKTVVFIPREFTLSNYVAMWNELNAPVLYLNSILWSVILAGLQMVSCMFVAYGLARFKFKGRGFIFALVMLSLVVPVQLLTEAMKLRYKAFNPITMFSMNPVVFSQFAQGPNLIGSWTVLILMSATAVMYKNGLFIFLLRQYFKNQPKELEEAAYIDGAGTIRTFLQVMLPSAIPLLVTVFLFAFVWVYNDNTYITILNPAAQVMSNKVGSAGGQYVKRVLDDANNHPLIDIFNGASLILHISPLIILYLFCQRFFVQSIERSGMVG